MSHQNYIFAYKQNKTSTFGYSQDTSSNSKYKELNQHEKKKKKKQRKLKRRWISVSLYENGIGKKNLQVCFILARVNSGF